jgi:poly-gamma-glutamate synthesis protein (capsule biosynthesis protein)
MQQAAKKRETVSDVLSLFVAGDCGPAHGPAEGIPIESYTTLVPPVLEQADMRFVNCMRAYSSRGIREECAPQVRQPVEIAAILQQRLAGRRKLRRRRS